jgi:RES domain-containing protein
LTKPTVYELVDSVDRIRFKSTVFRHMIPGRNCTSGAGARQAGGRWNPPDSFPVVYTGLKEETVIEEFYRLAERSSLPPESFLPRIVCKIDVDLGAVLDLRSEENLSVVGLTLDHLSAYSMDDCQRIGEAAHRLGLEGLLAPSATGTGEILAIFELNLRNESVVQEQDRIAWSSPPTRGGSEDG